jgi:hypothetical protein
MRVLNFSGAPALLLPRSALPHWHGILVRDEARDETPDFEDGEGGAWFVHDAFDFANPVTHYDHLCAAFQDDEDGNDVRVVRVGDAEALAISDGSDAFAWWAQRGAILANTTEPPSDEAWAQAEWTPRGEIEVGEATLVLMNASVHGAQILAGDEASEHEPVALAPSRYRVESAHVDGALVVKLSAL